MGMRRIWRIRVRFLEEVIFLMKPWLGSDRERDGFETDDGGRGIEKVKEEA